MRSRRAFLAATGVAALAGCLGDTGDEQTTTTTTTSTTTSTTTTTTTEPQPQLDSASLLLNWKPNGLHVPYYTAAERGFYEDEGLPPVTINAGQGSTFSAKQAGLTNTEFAITSSDQAVVVNARDVNVQVVGVMMQRSPVVVFTANEIFGGELTDLSQLEGKTVGTGPGMVEVLTELLLERQGVLDDVTMTNTGFSTVQQLLAGEIDAAGGVFGDAIAAQHQGYETSSIPVADFIPSYGHVVATNPSFAQNNSVSVEAFLRATAKGTAYAMNNPDDGAQHLLDANPELETTKEAVKDNWTRMADGFLLTEAVRNNGWGWSSEEPWTSIEGALRGAGTIEGSVDLNSVYTNDYLDMDYRYVDEFASIVSE